MSNHSTLYTKSNPHIWATLSSKGFRIHQHIAEIRGVWKVPPTVGHTVTRMAEKAPRDNISRHACMGFSPPSSARETPLTQIARVPRGDISLPCCNTFFVPSHKAKAFVLECKTREILSRLQAQRGTGLCVLIPPRNHKLSVNFFISHESAHAGQRESYKNSTQPNPPTKPSKTPRQSLSVTSGYTLSLPPTLFGFFHCD